MDTIAEALPIELSIEVLSGREMIPTLTDGMTSGKVGFGVDMLTELFLMATIVAAVALEVVLPVSHATDVQADVVIDVLAGTPIGVVSGIGVDMFASVNTIMWSAFATTLKFIPMSALIEEALPFGCAACRCSPITTCNCCALQA